MSTQKNNNSQGVFNQPSMTQYNQMQQPLGNTLTQLGTNPFGKANPTFGAQQQMGTNQANNLNQSSMNNITGNINASGMMGGAGSPAALEMMQNQSRAGTSNTANLGFLQPVQNALSMQQNALGQMNQYRPLQTGQNSQETTSGLGTWLPQLLGAALGGGMSALTGGLLGGGGGGGGSSSFMPGDMFSAPTGNLPQMGGMSSMPSMMPPPGGGFGGGFNPVTMSQGATQNYNTD